VEHLRLFSCSHRGALRALTSENVGQVQGKNGRRGRHVRSGCSAVRQLEQIGGALPPRNRWNFQDNNTQCRGEANFATVRLDYKDSEMVTDNDLRLTPVVRPTPPADGDDSDSSDSVDVPTAAAGFAAELDCRRTFMYCVSLIRFGLSYRQIASVMVHHRRTITEVNRLAAQTNSFT
jgi:hypothetical protein